MPKSNQRLIVGLLTLAWLGWTGACVTAEPIPSLDDLLKDYKAFGLPLPPKEAKLVRYEAGGGGIVNHKVQPKVFGLAFQIKPGTKGENPLLLVGTRQWQPNWDPHPQEVEPEPAAAKDLELSSDDGLALALQCHDRGWVKLARHLWDKSQKKVEVPPRTQLIRLSWYYWEVQLTRPKTDRAPIAKRLKELIRQDKQLDTEDNRALLKSLDLTLVTGNAKPGSIEALIDDLVDYNADTGTIGIFGLEERYVRIARLGFDAVPALIDHLDDDRLTRAMMEGFNNFPFWNLRVRDVVSDLLEGLAGPDLGRNWLRRQQGDPVEKAAAKRWWDKAHKIGEEAYVLDQVFPAPGEHVEVSPHLLIVIQAKYPKHVPSLYRIVLDKRPDLDSRTLANAVHQGNLPDKEKLDLFLYAARKKDNFHRLYALEMIEDLDRKQFNSLLRAAIENFPKDVAGPYWICPEAFIANLVNGSDDLQIWQALEKVARRSAVGFRMELLNQISASKDSRHRLERLRLLASFLDDAALRDQASSGKFEGPCAGFFYDKLEVRDFVALQIANLVGIEVELNLDRTPEQWAAIRSQVRAALKRELGKTDH